MGETFPMGKYPKLSPKEFASAFKDWTDFDWGAYQLGRAMGMFDPEASFQTDLKGVFWSANPTSDFLYRMLEGLVHLGLLEKDEEDDRMRWKGLSDVENPTA